MPTNLGTSYFRWNSQLPVQRLVSELGATEVCYTQGGWLAAFNNSLRQGKYKILRQTSYVQNCEPESSLYFRLNKMRTYKYEIHILAVYCRGKRVKGYYALWGLVCVNWRKKPQGCLLSVCKVLTLKSEERNEYGKTEMSTICLKGKISGSLLPSMNLRILSLSTERLTSCERKRNAIERLCVRKCFTKKKSKKIKMKKRKKNSSFVVITSRGNTVAWSVNYSVPTPWTSVPAGLRHKALSYLSSTVPSTVNRSAIRSGSLGSTSLGRDWQSSGQLRYVADFLCGVKKGK